VVGLAGVSLAGCWTGRPTRAERAEVARWVAARGVPATPAAIVSAIGDAPVVVLGEASHGVEEALALRNDVFRALVASRGFTGIALETGYAESVRLDAFVSGAPGDATTIARESFTSGFGAFQANVDLIRWMRSYNQTALPDRRLRLFGLDLSLGGPAGSTPTDAPQRCADDRTLPARITDQCAVVAAQARDVDRANPPWIPGAPMPRDAWKPLEVRDRALAVNALWAWRQLGAGGRLLVFAHDAHAMNTSRRGGTMRRLARSPRSMGQDLRSALGPRLVIVAEASPDPAARIDTAEVGDLVRGAADGPVLLDLRSDARTTATLQAPPAMRERRRLRINGGDVAHVTPAWAFDLLVVQTQRSPARPAGS
jgi:erythromycin esterase-like protein